MSKFSTIDHDGQILIAHDNRRGIVAYELGLKTRGGIKKLNRTVLTLPTTSHAHTLQLFGLTAALRSITNAMRGELPNAYRARPRIVVKTSDESFLDALAVYLNPATTTATDAKPLRAGRQFKDVAAKVLSKFALTVETETDNSPLVLRQWAGQNVPDPTGIDNANRIFAPVALSQRAV